MSWAKVDDQWWSHPKVMQLSLEARGLWITALSWSCAQRRDVVPFRFVQMVTAGADECAAEIVDAGLWITEANGYRIHDWSEYQELTLSEKRAAAGRVGGLRSGETRSKPQASTKQTGSKPDLLDPPGDEANGKQEPKQVSRPVPSRPVPTPRVRGSDDAEAKPSESRPRDPIWDTLIEMFGEVTNDSSHGARNRATALLRQSDATPDQMKTRAQAWPAHFEDATLTDLALAKHWDTLGRPPARASDDQVRDLNTAVERKRRRDRVTQDEPG